MPPELTVGIFGLVGVLIGGVITAGSTYLLALRSERQRRLKDDQNLRLDLKRAARLIHVGVFQLAMAIFIRV